MKKILLLLPAILGYLFICAQSWDIKGNAGTNPDSNFVGTIDAKPLLFRVYNVKAGQINPATNNTSFGVTTLNFNTTGINNTALGSGALSNNTSGQLNTALGTFSLLNNTLGSLNTAVGAYSMYTNSGGVWNTAQGQRSLYANTSGNGNVAIGEESLLSNLTGSGNVGIGFMVMAGNTAGGGNVAIGDQAFKSNTSGDYNVAVGRTAMISNTSGAGNVAVGKDAMYWGSTGKYNTAVGTFSLNKTTISQYNTALGYNAAYNYNMGWNNTILGANCDVNAANLYNCIAIGQGVICTGVSQARIGNSATISIGGYVGWSNISDGRFKKDVKDNVKGLDFIMRLQPVTYHLDVAGIDNKLHEGLKQEPNESMQKAMAGKEKTVYSGFIAQDVEKAAKEAGYDFSGVDKPQDKNDLYGLRYAEFVVPLVKATQEQQQTIEEQGEMIKELIKQNTSLQKRIEELEKSAGVKQTPAVTDLLSIWPNPSDGKLFISINTTQKTTAVINVTDAKGAIIKREQKQLVPGDNQFNVDIKGVANGIYTVSAEWNDGRMKKIIAGNKTVIAIPLPTYTNKANQGHFNKNCMRKLIFFLSMAGLALAANSQSWNITGNAGINPAIHFLGTTDQASLVFRVHNRYSGEIDSVKQKTFFGYGAGVNTTGLANTALGFKSLYFNTTGNANTAQGAYSLYSNTTGSSNAACGYSALYSNTTGSLNTAMGANVLVYNTTGSGNTGTGTGALFHNTTGGGNTADGRDALASNTTGIVNTAVGMIAMNGNTTGSYNTALGYAALQYAGSGNYNVGVGANALLSPNTSQYNVAVGANAGINYSVGWNNTLIGANTNVNANDRYNCIALGQDIVCTANSQARIGNLATNSIGGYANWSNFSDGRYKKDVTANVKGIDFIMKLQPVTYHLDASGLDKKLHEGMKRETNEFTQKAIAEKEKIVFSGFIAQDVEKAANEVGYDFSGVDKPQNKDDFYGLRYAEFVVPLVKATQEQQQMIQELVKQGAQLQQRLEQLEKNAGNKPAIGSPDLLTVWPNPSEGILFISISSAQKTTAVINVTDAKGAIIKKEQKQLVPGDNQFAIDIKGLAYGMYTVLAEWSGGKMKRSAQVLKQ